MRLCLAHFSSFPPYPNGSLVPMLSHQTAGQVWGSTHGTTLQLPWANARPEEATEHCESHPCGQRPVDDRQCMTARRCANVLAGGAQFGETGLGAGRGGLNVLQL